MKIAALVIVLVLAIGLIGASLWLYTPDLPRHVLEAKYKVSAVDYRKVAGLRIRVRDGGRTDAPVVMFLHGFGSSLETWDAWADALAPDHRVISFDWPGFGLTGADPTHDYSDKRSLAVLAALMDDLGVAKASLVGNSMGGQLAWMFAAAEPARVDRLVLVSPAGFAGPGFAYHETPDIPMVTRLLPYTLPTVLVRMSLKPAYGDPARLSATRVERYQDFMRAPGVRDAMIARMEQVSLDPPEPALRRITAPTLLVWGEKDGMIPFTNAADYVKLIPDVRLVAFPDLGHVPQEEAPMRSLEPVQAFLRP